MLNIVWRRSGGTSISLGPLDQFEKKPRSPVRDAEGYSRWELSGRIVPLSSKFNPTRVQAHAEEDLTFVQRSKIVRTHSKSEREDRREMLVRYSKREPARMVTLNEPNLSATAAPNTKTITHKMRRGVKSVDNNG
ncbi:hypothetical protein DFH09DRAFT_1275198 [Mycena vulgaris]|nr:hypothetical protein DFH09DRAFT_1275198 [Mycena vulgaris]